MNIKSKAFNRGAAVVAAIAVVVGAFAPLMQDMSAIAATATSRRIRMSDSTPSASGVQYEVTFTPVSNAQELIVDFCGDSPLIGATCAFAPTSVPNVASATASTGTLSLPGSGTPKHTLRVTGLTMTAATPYTITFSNITNPTSSTPGSMTFYARVYTYTTGGAANYVQADVSGGTTTIGANNVDSGGIALSTTNQVTITARVMESLTFCASGSNIDGSGGASSDECSEATAPALQIGQGTPVVLDASRVDVASAYTQISTNATYGAIVRMKATNTCTNGGLSNTGGAACNIPGLADGTFTNGESPMAMPAGTAAYGLFVGLSSTTTGIASSTGTVTPDANYYTAAHDTGGEGYWYGMDRRNTTDGVLSTYGDAIASSAGPVSRINNELRFAATPSLTTPAGIYTGNEILIATGTF